MLVYKYHCTKWLRYLKGRITTNQFALLKGLTSLPAFSYQSHTAIARIDELPSPPSYITTINPAKSHVVSGGFTQPPPRRKGGTPHIYAIASPRPQAGRLSGFLGSSNHNIWGPEAALQPEASHSPRSKRSCKTDTAAPWPSWQKDIASGKQPPGCPTHWRTLQHTEAKVLKRIGASWKCLQRSS